MSIAIDLSTWKESQYLIFSRAEQHTSSLQTDPKYEEEELNELSPS